MNSAQSQIESVAQPSDFDSKDFIVANRPSISIFRVAISLALVMLALLLVGFLADWPQLKLALRQLGGQPWLVGVLVLTYTGAFLLRTIAWRVLMTRSTGMYQLFVSIQTGLLVNHLTPIKLGEFIRPLLAARYGVPIAEAAATTAIARYLDFAAPAGHCCGSGACCVPLCGGAPSWLKGLALPAGVIVGCGVALVAMRQSLRLSWLPGPLRNQIELLRSQLRQVSAGRVAHAALWTLPSWALEAGVIIVAAQALGIELSIAGRDCSYRPSPFCFRCST